MFWLYLVTGRAGSWAMLRGRAEEAAPAAEGATVELLDCFEGSSEAVAALVRLESRLAKESPRVRPSIRAGARSIDRRGH